MIGALAFELPAALEAREPPEARGLARDQVRLLVARRWDEAIEHRRFHDLPELLEPGDLLVVNVSATLPAAVPATREATRERFRVHFSTRAAQLDPSWRVVELRSADSANPRRANAGETLLLPDGGSLELVVPYASGARLMLGHFEHAQPLERYLADNGEPIQYGYVDSPWPLERYQNVYATTPGSAEMPSAGRPFTGELLTALLARGILVAPITLHTGVSSPERHEPPFPEWFQVPDATARLIDAVHDWEGRVIAVGTTVVRALESAVDEAGTIAPASGWTSLVITPEQRPQVVDGLITGWHEPEASHLQMLGAIAGAEVLERSYGEALAAGYLWHEFGDSHLIID